MDALAENTRAVIGGNAPPQDPTPFEIAAKAIEDVYSEASLWLDGAEVNSTELAEGIDNLKKTIARARKDADEARKIENKPFDDGKAEVQARYNPLLKKADLAKDACNKALEPWLKKEADRIEAEARAKREAAAELQRKAEEAIRATDAANLEERAAAEQLVKDAKKAGAVANRAEKQTATAGGMLGRATGLRSYWIATMTDTAKAGKWGWTYHKSEILEFITGLAQKDATAGQREIEGFAIIEEKRAV